MGIELITQHCELRALCLVFQPLKLIRLLLDRQEEVNGIIKRRPRSKQREVKIKGTQEKLHPCRVACPILRRTHPGVANSKHAGSRQDHKDRHAPRDERQLPKHCTENNSNERRDRKSTRLTS